MLNERRGFSLNTIKSMSSSIKLNKKKHIVHLLSSFQQNTYEGQNKRLEPLLNFDNCLWTRRS